LDEARIICAKSRMEWNQNQTKNVRDYLFGKDRLKN
jgi:hypothetical protein